MPIANIVDCRTNRYNINVMVVFEDSWHDNCIKDATQFNFVDNIDYLGIKETTVERAIKFANKRFTNEVTLYLYDVGECNYIDYSYIDNNNLLVR